MTPLGLRRTVIAGGLGIVLLYYGAGRAAQPEPDHHETLYVFGTLVELVIHGVEDSAAREAIAEVGALFQTLHRDWHAWEAGELGKLNAAIAEGGAFRTDARLANLLREGVALSCQSGGRFDPAIGALVALWGFHEDSPPEGEMPDAAAVAALTARAPRMSDLRFDGDTVGSVDPAVQLDLGGYAKGAALDLAGALLQARGIGAAVLDAGGDVNVIGGHGALGCGPQRVAAGRRRHGRRFGADDRRRRHDAGDARDDRAARTGGRPVSTSGGNRAIAVALGRRPLRGRLMSGKVPSGTRQFRHDGRQAPRAAWLSVGEGGLARSLLHQFRTSRVRRSTRLAHASGGESGPAPDAQRQIVFSTGVKP